MFADIFRRGFARVRSGVLCDGLALAALASAAVISHFTGTAAMDAMTRQGLAATALDRASHAILRAPYAVLSILEYDDNTLAGRDAPILFRDAVKEARSSLDEAMRLAPDRSDRIAGFKTRFEPMIATAEAALAIGNRTPGLTKGAELTPDDLAELAAGARMAAEADVQLQSLAQDVSDFGHAFAAASSKAKASLEGGFDAAIFWIAAAGFAASAYFRVSGRRRLLSQAILRRRVRWTLNEAQTGDPRGPGSDFAANPGSGAWAAERGGP